MTNEPDAHSTEAFDSDHQAEHDQACELKKGDPAATLHQFTHGKNIQESCGAQGKADFTDTATEEELRKSQVHVPQSVDARAGVPPSGKAETFGSPLMDEAQDEIKPGESTLDKDAMERSMSSVSKLANWGTPSTVASLAATSPAPAENIASPPGPESNVFEADRFAQACAPPPTPVTATNPHTGVLSARA